MNKVLTVTNVLLVAVTAYVIYQLYQTNKKLSQLQPTINTVDQVNNTIQHYVEQGEHVLDNVLDALNIKN